jgi:hypothetical protein
MSDRDAQRRREEYSTTSTGMRKVVGTVGYTKWHGQKKCRSCTG